MDNSNRACADETTSVRPYNSIFMACSRVLVYEDAPVRQRRNLARLLYVYGSDPCRERVGCCSVFRVLCSVLCVRGAKHPARREKHGPTSHAKCGNTPGIGRSHWDNVQTRHINSWHVQTNANAHPSSSLSTQGYRPVSSSNGTRAYRYGASHQPQQSATKTARRQYGGEAKPNIPTTDQ